MYKFSFSILFLFSCFFIIAQTSEDPAHWVSYCIDWTVKSESDVLALGAKKFNEVDLRPNGPLMKFYIINKNSTTNIQFTSSSMKDYINSVSYHVDYIDKNLFDNDANMVRQIMIVYKGYIKSNHQGSIFPQNINKPNAFQLEYYASFDNIYEISITTNSDYDPSNNGKWFGFIWVDVNRK